MYALQKTMPLLIHARHPLLRRHPPRQKHHALRPHPRHSVNDLLRKPLPSMVRVAVRLVRTDRETGIQHEDAAIGPGGEEAAVSGGRGEVGVVFFDGRVDVFEGGRGGGGGPDGEAEAVGLVEVVVGVLAEDNGFDGGEGGVAGPE